MPINPSIPLQARAPQVQAFDPTQAYLTFAQLKRLQQQSQLDALTLQEAQQLQGERGRLRELSQQWSTSGESATPDTLASLRQTPGPLVETVNRPGFPPQTTLVPPRVGEAPGPHPDTPVQAPWDFETFDRKAMAAAPTLWPGMRTQFQDTQLKGLQVRTAKRLELASVLDYAVRSAPLVRDQASYDVFLESVRGLGFPMEHASKAYSPQAIQSIMQVALPLKEQIEQTNKEADRQLKRQELQAKGLKVDYGLGNDLDAAVYARYGEELGPMGRPTTVMVEQARQDVETQRLTRARETGSEAATITATRKPLEGIVAKEVGDINAVLAQHADITTLYKADYVGPIRGRWGSVKGVTGDITTDEVQLRRSIEDMKDTLLRARSGAAITQQEYTRLSGLVPNVTDQPVVFEGKLEGFARAAEQLREEKLRVATTARSALREQTPAPRPLSSAAPAAGAKSMTPQDVLDAMQQTGKSRAEVIEAAKARGYAVQGAP